MNKSILISSTAAIVGAFVVLGQNAHSQVIAYQNSATSFNANYNFNSPTYPAGEAGNEVKLAGTDYTITSFAFQYDLLYSGNSPVPSPTGVTADVKFYANNGTPSVSTAGYPPPGAVLFNSGPLAVGAGGFTPGTTENLTLGAGVLVPQDFTWTVTFSGLAADESAGLALYGSTTTLDVNTASIGQNYGDAWEDLTGTPGGWTLINSVDSGAYPATFGAIITVPDSSCLPFSAGTVVLALGWMKRFARKA